ncbi:MAG TPA: CoA transferase [Steroidobacteraceae bacterium]|nr:CoA transferase [Steroidobacteraceae bacterium]
MNLLDGHRILALELSERSALGRFLESLGATVERIGRAALSDASALERRLAAASMLLDQVGLPSLEALGWARSRLETLNPALVHVSITPFGSFGPRASWAGSELVVSALGGVLGLTGTPDRAPVKEALDACGFHADMVAAAGAMAAHYERTVSGIGQHVDVSVQEVAFSRNVNGILVWQFDRRKHHRVGGALTYGRATVRCIWSLADGWCFHTLMTGRLGAPANQALSDWIDECGLRNPLRGTDWVHYNRSTLDPRVRADWETALDAFFRTRTKADIADEGRRRGINAAPVQEPADVLADPHLAARRYWAELDGARVPGRFVCFNDGATASSPPQRSGSRPGPLAGVRVLDFSWALVGSITTKTLGDLGAEVVKLESRTRPCLSRIDVQVAASRQGDFDDKPWFAHLNSSKRSLALDLKKPESRAVLEPLIRWADIVVENFSPGTMAKLGLAFDELQRLHPGVILVSGSVYGQTGPRAHEWGVDGTGAAMSSRTYLTGWPDRDPVIPGAVPYGDVIVPYAMAAAATAALAQRRATGRGVHVDASMYEICAQQMSEALVEAQKGRVPQRLGNADPRCFHQGVYPTEGEDRWIAISCRSTAEWQRLCGLAGLIGAGEAQASRAACDERLAAWTAGQAGAELAARLQAAGIPAGEVQDIEDLIEHDPQIAARGALLVLDHPALGPFGHVRTPMTFSRSPIVPFRAPAIGEHSREIASTIAGLSAERIEELERLGVFR